MGTRWTGEPGSSPWDEYIGIASMYFSKGVLDDEETDYKLAIGGRLTEARRALLDGEGDWVARLRSGLTGQAAHPLNWRPGDRFRRWVSGSPEEAEEALRGLWTRESSPVSERIRAFCDIFPDSEMRGAGTRANLVSVLLMGLDVERYPPFRVRLFDDAYRRTGYNLPPRNADEAALYEHALGFLDRFTIEAEKRGLPVRHRLDAQSFVWKVPYMEAEYRELGVATSEAPEPLSPSPPPSLEELAGDLYLSVEFLEGIEGLLEEKKQVIFQGPPGTGKTFVAQALAEHLAGSEERVTLVQLHPSYAYEDFVQGFRPTLVGGQPGFELRDGPLLRAAKRAREEPGESHFLVIDEINRGNVARVFGELYFLLEYRDREMDLQYQQERGRRFSMPPNLYVIGTMNTADRSIALVDLALRRRFYFVDFHPDEEPVKGVLRLWLADNAPGMEWVADVVDAANKNLSNDRHAAIGPSYFMKPGLDDEAVKRVWQHSVLPYIEERLYGEPDRVQEFYLDRLRREVSGRQEEEAAGAEDEGGES